MLSTAYHPSPFSSSHPFSHSPHAIFRLREPACEGFSFQALWGMGAGSGSESGSGRSNVGRDGKRKVEPGAEEKRERKREERRREFFGKVKRGREEWRWEGRAMGEKILQRDYVTQLRQWEEEQDRSAPQQPEEEEEIEFEDETKILADVASSNEGSSRVDDMLRRERQELEALMSLMEDVDAPTAEEWQSAMTDYGSDDDEDNDVFQYLNEVAEAESKRNSAVDMSLASPNLCEDMDMSPG